MIKSIINKTNKMYYIKFLLRKIKSLRKMQTVVIIEYKILFNKMIITLLGCWYELSNSILISISMIKASWICIFFFLNSINYHIIS